MCDVEGVTPRREKVDMFDLFDAKPRSDTFVI